MYMYMQLHVKYKNWDLLQPAMYRALDTLQCEQHSLYYFFVMLIRKQSTRLSLLTRCEFGSTLVY